MTGIEIVLILAGIVICVASFVIPAKKEELSDNAKNIAHEEIKGIVAKELDTMKDHLEEMLDEATNQAMETAERNLEKVSNEKIEAVSEYSETVLEDIHKNHQEVVFMYDMLNDKQENLKTTVQKSDASLKELIMEAKDLESDFKIAKNSSEEHAKTNQINENKNSNMNVLVSEKSKERTKKSGQRLSSQGRKESSNKDSEDKGQENKKADFKTDEAGIDLYLSGNTEGEDTNNNKQILMLHSAGKSNMAIARELGLGMGEVRLVIDLYEGAEDKI